MTLTDEEKEICEKKFSKFILQKIENFNGSLSFQHLIGLLPQLPFDVKSAVGSTKVELMKFLKSHSKIFKVDSRGIVTAVQTYAAEDDHRNDMDSTMLQVKNSLPSPIQNGKGRISKLHSEFGFIKANAPIETNVYFRAVHLSGDKDDLLAEHDLTVGLRVCFNAVIGYNDCDAPYRATKVWREPNKSHKSDNISNLNEANCNVSKGDDSLAKFANKSGKQRETEEGNLNGEGIIQKVFPQMGFISVAGKINDTIYFHINDLEDFDGDDLTKILKSGDDVEFAAARSNKKDSRAKWKAIAVWKKYKRNKQKNEEKYINSDVEEITNSRSGNKHSVIDTNGKRSRKEMLKDQPGKISFLSNGVNITFGEDFTKIANGDVADYFLYGAKVTDTKDVQWEFSDGDDVRFDAVEIKAEPGWKAVLVWVGDKPDYVLPTCLGDFSEFTDDEPDEMPAEKSYLRSKNCSSSEGSVKTNTHSNTKQPGKRKNIDHHGKHKFENKFEEDYTKQNLRSPQSRSQSNTFARESNKHKQRKESQIRDATFSKSKGEKNPTRNRRVSHSRDQQKKYLSKNNANQNLLVSEKSDNEIEDQDDDQTVSTFLNSSYKNKHLSKKSINQPKGESSTSLLESEADHSEHNAKVSEYKKNNYVKSSIKEFQNINVTVTKVNCKFAFAENPDLQEKVHFFSNAFYRNGQSMEEQQVDDLREIISSGVNVQLNCFEIVDDSGKIHHKVTMAWLGEKPKISEITPKEFIEEENLSVTIKDDSDCSDVTQAKNAPKKFLFAANNSGSEDENDRCTSPMKFSSSENASDDETSISSKCSKQSETNKHKVFLKKAESSVNYKLLSEIISQQLESKGLLYPDSEANLNALSAEIVDVIVQRHHSIKEYGNQFHPIKQHLVGDSVCSHCANALSVASSSQNSNLDKEVQTIITGEIVAQNTFFTKRNGES